MHYMKKEVSNDRKIENLVFHFVGSRATRKQMVKMSQCGKMKTVIDELLL
jgi:hypothetical protein